MSPFRVPTAAVILFGSALQAADPLPGHSTHGETFNEGPRQAAVLMAGTGKVDFPITTAKAEAQRFFNQGVGQLHGFWYYEAERSFRQVAMIDPNCAMAYWGMAMANVNNDKRARGFIAKAAPLKEKASAREKLWISALETFYKEDKRDKKQRALDFIRDIETIVQDHPKDLEAKAFLAWKIWHARDDAPMSSSQAVDALLDQVFAVNPEHPAHHYRIHLWDSGGKPARALKSAAVLGQCAPGIAHMWHMPGHTFSKLRRFDDAAWQQEASTRVDHAYMIGNHVLPDQIHNYAHNEEWLIRTYNELGRAHDAIALAKSLIAIPRHPTYNHLGKTNTSAGYGRTRLLETLQKWELWEELLKAAEGPLFRPVEQVSFETARLRALGVANYHMGRTDALAENVRALETLEKKTAATAAKAASAPAAKTGTSGVVKAEPQPVAGTGSKPVTKGGAKAAVLAQPKAAATPESKSAAAPGPNAAVTAATPISPAAKPDIVEAAGPKPSAKAGVKAEASPPAKAVAKAPAPAAAKESKAAPGDSKKNDVKKTDAQAIAAALTELRALKAILNKEADAEKRVQAVSDISKDRQAKLWLALGNTKKAQELIKDFGQELVALAAKTEVLAALGKPDDAKKAFAEVRKAAYAVDTELPLVARLKTLAASFDMAEEWRDPAPKRTDSGKRPSLSSLGPVHWHPPTAPAWEALTLKGESFSSQELAGKPALLLFYLGSTCGHCMTQINAFAKAAPGFEKAGIQIAGITVEPMSLAGQITEQMESKKAPPFPIYCDPSLGAFKAFHAYDDFEQQPLHAAVLIDAHGKLRWVDVSWDPFTDTKFLLEEARRLLSLPAIDPGS